MKMLMSGAIIETGTAQEFKRCLLEAVFCRQCMDCGRIKIFEADEPFLDYKYRMFKFKNPMPDLCVGCESERLST